ncbi:MAG: hypothetical protein M0C28_44290 [Candidatus Moduliflexus flocculans]|nr:hypothetical protein [Candidatus Moduliflexus flocculans]
MTATDESRPARERTRAELNRPPRGFLHRHCAPINGSARRGQRSASKSTPWIGSRIRPAIRSLLAEFKQVRWEKTLDEERLSRTYTPVYTAVSSSNLATGARRQGALSFRTAQCGNVSCSMFRAAARTRRHSSGWAVRLPLRTDLPNQRLETDRRPRIRITQATPLRHLHPEPVRHQLARTGHGRARD